MPDTFDALMRRRGWRPTNTAPMRGDPKVIQWRTRFSKEAAADQATFYDAIGNNTVRKLIRAILTEPKSRDDLVAICPNESKLDDTLTYLQAGGVVTQVDGAWSKGPQCKKADNIGSTFEWYVAEWFKRELKATVRRSVHVEEMLHGGDLDVVAFLDNTRVWVECKTKKPEDISDRDVRLFLQRAFDFRPEIGILLIDTESSVAKLAQDVSNLWSRLLDLSYGHEYSTPTETEAKPIPGYTDIYWCAQQIYVASVEHSVDRSLSNVLRFHDSHAKRQRYVPIVGKWNFEREEVQADREEADLATDGPYAVHGMIWERM